MSVGTRREERERALSLLYEAEAKDMRAGALLAQLPVSPEPFVVDLVTGVDTNCARIDDLIARHSIDWALDRMPAVDRNLLRLGAYELLERPDIPTGAVISEAVELAKRYSTEESGRFVNGVLASIVAEVRPAGGGQAAGRTP
jgi:transcription antitermination protein NusB